MYELLSQLGTVPSTTDNNLAFIKTRKYIFRETLRQYIKTCSLSENLIPPEKATSEAFFPRLYCF